MSCHSSVLRRLLVVAAVLGVSSSAAAVAETSVTVLGIEHVDVPDTLAHQLTDALRQRAAAAGVRVVPGKDLIEIKMIFSCESEAPACMAQAGKTLGADKLLYGTLKKARGSNVVVSLKVFDVRTGAVEKAVNETVSKRELAAGSVSLSASRWFGALVEVETKPVLTVTSDPPNAAVTVDGAQMGRTPVTLRDLAPGAHVVGVSAPGRLPASRTVELRPGDTSEIALTLEPEQKPVPPPVPLTPEPLVTPVPKPELTPRPGSRPQGHPGRPAKIAALALLGGAVASGAVAIYTWRTYVDYQDKAFRLLDANKDQLTTAEARDFAAMPGKYGCTPPPSVPSAAQFKEYCTSGTTWANATTALWVVAGALATVSVISYVVGDRQAARAAEKQQRRVGLVQKLRFEPVISTHGGGLHAAFEF